MKSFIYTFLLIAFVYLFTGCSGFQLEEEIPNEFAFQEQVFITGLLTSESGFVSLEIQNSIPADSSGFNPINNAQVSLYAKENTNADAVLVTDSFSVDNGKYTSSTEITPIEGYIYWAEIILEDGTTVKSEEETLKESVALSIVDLDDITRINIEDENDEENFYLIFTEYNEGDTLISNHWHLIEDVNNDSEIFFAIDNRDEGVTFTMHVYNVNFNTFQFYFNSLTQLENEVDIFFSPLKILQGNLTNASTDKVVLGNFGIAGYSVITKEF